MTDFTGAAGKAGRAMLLTKRRQKMQEEMLLRKRKIEDELKIGRIDKKFASHYDAIEQELRTSTIGLVTLDQMKTKQENIMKERERQLSLIKQEEDKRQKDKAQKKLTHSLKQASALSFNFEEEDVNDESESEANQPKDTLVDKNNDEVIIEIKNRKKYGKDPTIDTSFLPDKDREEEENRLRDQLRLEWVQKQEQIKSEEIEIVYSYWDGSGHRRTAKMTKGSSIQQFLVLCLDSLRKEEVFHELKTVTVDNMMFVKEDLIIPHTYTFYDFIVTKARGKSGPLFNFDAYDDIRLRSDASIDKDESHAGKVVLRSWYDKNKHIFPASRWEPFDPNKKWEAYTIADKDPRRF